MSTANLSLASARILAFAFSSKSRNPITSFFNFESPPAEAEVKEEVDTDDDVPITSASHEEDLQDMTRMEAEYDAYLQGKRKEIPSFRQVRVVGARLSKFARSNATRRTQSVESRSTRAAGTGADPRDRIFGRGEPL